MTVNIDAKIMAKTPDGFICFITGNNLTTLEKLAKSQNKTPLNFMSYYPAKMTCERLRLDHVDVHLMSKSLSHGSNLAAMIIFHSGDIAGKIDFFMTGETGAKEGLDIVLTLG